MDLEGIGLDLMMYHLALFEGLGRITAGVPARFKQSTSRIPVKYFTVNPKCSSLSTHPALFQKRNVYSFSFLFLPITHIRP
jgi:hypothetical protein